MKTFMTRVHPYHGDNFVSSSLKRLLVLVEQEV